MSNNVRDFYDDLAGEYDAIYDDWDASIRRQAGIIKPLLKDANIVLDISAGMGTQAIGLALLGISVVARDLSPRLIARGCKEAARLGASLEFQVGNMLEAWPADAGQFSAVIAFDNSLPHLENDAELRLALKAAKLALRPGGQFLASIRDYDSIIRFRPAGDPAREMGKSPTRRKVLQNWAWDADGKGYSLEHIVMHEGPNGWTSNTRISHYHALLRSELESCAKAEGFLDCHWLMPKDSGFYQPIFMGSNSVD